MRVERKVSRHMRLIRAVSRMLSDRRQRRLPSPSLVDGSNMHVSCSPSILAISSCTGQEFRQSSERARDRCKESCFSPFCAVVLCCGCSRNVPRSERVFGPTRVGQCCSDWVNRVGPLEFLQTETRLFSALKVLGVAGSSSQVVVGPSFVVPPDDSSYDGKKKVLVIDILAFCG